MSHSSIVVILFRIYETGKLIADPQVISRGFLYQTEEKKITEDLIQAVKKAYNTEIEKQKKFDDTVRKIIRDSVTRAAQKVIRKSLDREPLILPLVVKS
jgi:ribonuclease J